MVGGAAKASDVSIGCVEDFINPEAGTVFGDTREIEVQLLLHSILETGAINLLGGKMRRVRAVCLPASEGVGPRVGIRLPPAASQERIGPPRCGDAGQYTNWIGTAGISVA